MKFGVGVDYSLKALLLLAERYPSTVPIRVEEIADTQDIPENYLRRLLIELKRGGLVASQKGPSGGYLLAKAPSRITMAVRDARRMARRARYRQHHSPRRDAPIARRQAQARPDLQHLEASGRTRVD